ncbi:MAG: VWA domain-containing protein, partial [Acidobacteriota bacterium]|nr:VWA domain-containing protein [Acidobacteriota bacterium]
MKLGTLVLAGVFLAAGVAAARQAQPQTATPPQNPTPQRPLFRGGARFVRVDVFPTGKDGKPIEGLTAEDFELFEDGKRQAVDTFEFVRIEPELEEARRDPESQREGEEWAKDPRARVFVVVLDRWHSEVLGGARMRRPLTDMLDRLIGPRDVFGVTTPEMSAQALVLGRKTVTIGDMLERHWTWGALATMTDRDEAQEFIEDCYGPTQGPAVNLPGSVFDQGLARELLARKRERDTIEHLDGLVEKLASIRDEKKAVVVVTQGWRQYTPNEARARSLHSALPGIYSGGGRISTRDPRPVASGGGVDLAVCAAQANSLLMMDTRRLFKDMLSRAQRGNVSFYPVDPRGLPVFDTPLSQGGPVSVADDFAELRAKRDGLMELANNTDGIALIHNNDLSATLRRFADSLGTYYLLGYYSANTKSDGAFRRIEVNVRQPDVNVRARRGYFAPTQAEADAVASGRAPESAAPAAEAGARASALARLG